MSVVKEVCKRCRGTGYVYRNRPDSALPKMGPCSICGRSTERDVSGFISHIYDAPTWEPPEDHRANPTRRGD